jgi:hypothetical protein
MDFKKLYQSYSHLGKNQATPRQILELLIYAYMNRIYSSRDIEKSCKRAINFMYLLKGKHAPDLTLLIIIPSNNLDKTTFYFPFAYSSPRLHFGDAKSQ